MENEVMEVAPPEMAMRTITERDVNTSGPGPYYVYLPSFTIGDLMRMTHSFAAIPAGEIFPIDNTRSWTQLNELPEGAAHRTREIKNIWGAVTDRHAALDIPAQTTLDALLADRVLTGHGLTVLDKLTAIDIGIETLNQMIQPTRIPECTFPTEFRAILEKEGMLKLRRQWLEQAAEQLATGRMLEDHRRVIEAHPFLRDTWKDAIENILIPAVDVFESRANTILAQKEEAIRSSQKQVYDRYDNTLMWLLARKPERTALSRTLEGAGRGGGIGIEEIRALVQEVVSATNGNGSGFVAETVSCPRCGNRCETVGGGPPQICWRCSHEFRPEDQPIAIAPEVASANGDVVSQDVDVEKLADKILADARTSKKR